MAVPSRKSKVNKFEELDFLQGSTPSKSNQKPHVTPSSRETPRVLKTQSSSKRNLNPNDAFSSPSLSKNLQSSSIKNRQSFDQPDLTEIKPLVTESFLTSNFLNRSKPFQTIETLNGHLPQHDRSNLPGRTSEKRLTFENLTDRENFKDKKYMFEKISDRSDVLDRLIEDYGAILAGKYGIEEWLDPSVVRQDDVWAVGRICQEVQDSKLTEQSCWLETSRFGGHGRRVWLKWDQDVKVRGVGIGEGGIGLFPGAIVGVRGRNGGGNYFSVQEILSMPVANPPRSKPEDLIRTSSSLIPLPISFCVACGPFAWDDDLEFLPFDALIAQLTKEKPDALILLGPFIDSNHPLIKNGDIDKMPQEIFREKIGSKIKKMLDNILPQQPIKIVLIPSQRDLLSSNLVFPQSEFSEDLKVESGLLTHKSVVRFLSNPVVFRINEIVIGICNVDVLMALRKEEFFKSSNQIVIGNDDGDCGIQVEEDLNSKDLISRACRHLLRQGSFYPLFPPTLGGGIDLVNLNVKQLDLLDLKSVGIDILILPTNFTAFSKVIDSRVIVNPRQLCKGKGTGSFSKFTIYPLDENSLKEIIDDKKVDEDGKIDHRVHERCRVDIIKI